MATDASRRRNWRGDDPWSRSSRLRVSDLLPRGSHPADHQEPARPVLRGPLAALLHALPAGECYIRSWSKHSPIIRSRLCTDWGCVDSLPLYRESVLPHESPLADRLSGHHGRGCHHLCPIPRFWEWCADCSYRLITCPRSRLYVAATEKFGGLVMDLYPVCLFSSL